MQKEPCRLSIVVPVYDEYDVIDLFHEELTQVVSAMGIEYEILFVDDGSRDGTIDRISKLAEHDPHVNGIQLSRNFGHQMALFAGLSEATGQYVLMMDGDLQHPPALIPELWKHAMEGCDIVFTVRKADEHISWFKNNFYF